MEACALLLCISCYSLSLMYECMNISIIYTPQVLDWTVYLWLKQYVGKKISKGPRVRPYTWLLCFYTTWWNQAVNKHAMDINSGPPHRIRSSASWQHWTTAQLPAAALLSCSLMNSWALLSQHCNRSAQALTHTCIGGITPSEHPVAPNRLILNKGCTKKLHWSPQWW